MTSQSSDKDANLMHLCLQSQSNDFGLFFSMFFLQDYRILFVAVDENLFLRVQVYSSSPILSNV